MNALKYYYYMYGFEIILTVAIIALTVIALYLFCTLPVYAMAKRAGAKNRWFAFFPVLQDILFDDICVNFHLGGLRIRKIGTFVFQIECFIIFLIVTSSLVSLLFVKSFMLNQTASIENIIYSMTGAVVTGGALLLGILATGAVLIAKYLMLNNILSLCTKRTSRRNIMVASVVFPILPPFIYCAIANRYPKKQYFAVPPSK